MMSGPDKLPEQLALHPLLRSARPAEGSCVLVLPSAGSRGTQQRKLEKLLVAGFSFSSYWLLLQSNQPSADRWNQFCG